MPTMLLPRDPLLQPFFSPYSRQMKSPDGARAVATLRKDLVAEHCSVWQDILALEGYRDWWLGITAAGMRWRRAHSAQNISKSLWPLVERTTRRSDMLITPTRRCWLGSAAAAATLETAA